jgi:catalase
MAEVTPSEAIDAVNSVFGRHPGYRALHAKGILCAGTFTATPEAATLTSAAHMQGEPVRATFRFSNGAGNPGHPDYAPDPRGLAAKFYLPDGSRTDIVAVSTPIFPVSTPDAFIALVKAQGAGVAAAVKLPLLIAREPSILRTLPALAASMRPAAGYSTIRYHGLHAFRWTDAGGGSRHLRYHLLPGDPEAHLSLPAARRRGRDYLQEGLRERLAAGPIEFALEVEIATPGDPVDDPSAAWPKGRRRLTVGRYEITGLETGRETGGDVLVFDPTRVTAGIECSADPVLSFRKAAYSESVARRTA